MNVDSISTPYAIEPLGGLGFLVFSDGGGHFTVSYPRWSFMDWMVEHWMEGELFLIGLLLL